jgi:dCMP deaminase
VQKYITHYPCLQCCKALIQGGIKKVYYAVDYKNHPYAVELFKQANVSVEHVALDNSLDVEKNQEKHEFISSLLDKLAKTDIDEEVLQGLYRKADLLFL